MDLLSFFKRTAAAPAAKPVSDSQDAVQELRLRARRRLIGAAVLVCIGVIGFPLVFETQPRPIPVDLPIEIPRKDALPPLAIPAPAPVPAAAASQEAPVQTAELGKGIITEAREPEAKPAPAIASAPRPAEKVADKAVERAKPELKTEPKAELRPEKKPAELPKADAKAEAARVQALLEGKPAAEKKASDASGARFIVQVGAYAEAKAAQEARSKVEKLGLKTYTQAVDTADGKRIRVRVGPFASREEADKAAAKVRGGGLSTAVLTL